MKLPEGYIVEFEYEYEITKVTVFPTTKELIKCKDCKHFEPYRNDFDGQCKLQRMTDDGLLNINVMPDDYCNHAERREEE